MPWSCCAFGITADQYFNAKKASCSTLMTPNSLAVALVRLLVRSDAQRLRKTPCESIAIRRVQASMCMDHRVSSRGHFAFQHGFGGFLRFFLRPRPFGEVQDSSPFVHVALYEPRSRRDARVRRPLCFIAVAVEARLLGQGSSGRRIPRRFARGRRVTVVAAVGHKLNSQERPEHAETDPKPPSRVEAHRHLHRCGRRPRRLTMQVVCRRSCRLSYRVGRREGLSAVRIEGSRWRPDAEISMMLGSSLCRGTPDPRVRHAADFWASAYF